MPSSREDDPQVPNDSNWCENQIRPIALGRKIGYLLAHYERASVPPLGRGPTRGKGKPTLSGGVAGIHEMANSVTPHERRNRWLVMADLFVDNEVDYKAIAEALVRDCPNMTQVAVSEAKRASWIARLQM